jgi:anti-sigma factor RsiW
MTTRDAPASPAPGDLPPRGAPPTDLELMLWVDGELDAERAREIADLVRRDARVRAIVTALRQGSQVIAEEALLHAELANVDSIADSVMDVIDAADAAASRRFIAPRKRAPAWRGPAIAALGIALAAAASWTLIFPSELTQVAKRTPATVSSGATAAANEEESTGGISIDVVDFGARPGTIFYVPSEDESILPVVWLTEDDTPSNEDDTPSIGDSP